MAIIVGSLSLTSVLIAGAGVFSGLTVGYMGLSELELEANELHGTEEEKRLSMIIRPMLKDRHLLLVTLLLGNAMCFEMLPIFIHTLVPAWAAILIATTFLLIFGEIIPQALCVGPNQIKIAAALTPVVKLFVWLFYPISYFIAKGLDWFLGVHSGARYNRKMLIDIISLHKKGNSALRRPNRWPFPERGDCRALCRARRG